LYANDLDIFGKGSLFEFLCTARTRSGQETLAKWLCSPASRAEILRRHEAIDELRTNLDLREDLAAFGPNRAAIDFDLAREWALRPLLLNSPVARAAAPFLVALTIGTIGFWYWFQTGASLVTLAVAAQIGFALLYRQRVSEVVLAIHEPAGELSILQTAVARLQREPFSSAKLGELQAALQAGGKTVSRHIGSLIGLAAMLDYRRNPTVGPFLPVFLWSTQIAFAAEAWRERYGAKLPAWMAIAGEFEALCALAGFAFEHPEYPFPEIVEGETRLDGTDLRHPLLPQSRCVANSIGLGSELQLLNGKRLQHVWKEHAPENNRSQSCIGSGGSSGLCQATEVLSANDRRHGGSSRFSAKWKVALLRRNPTSQGNYELSGSGSSDLVLAGRNSAGHQFA